MNQKKNEELFEKLGDDDPEFLDFVKSMIDYKDSIDNEITLLRLRRSVLDTQINRLQVISDKLEKLYHPNMTKT